MNSLPVDMDEVLHAVIPVGQWKEPSNQSQVNSVILPFSPERLGQQYPTSSLSSISLKIQHPCKTRLNQQDQGCSGWGETESNPVSDIGLILNGEICCTVERYWILEDSRKHHGCSKRIQQISRHCSRHCSSHKSSGDSRLFSRNCGIQEPSISDTGSGISVTMTCLKSSNGKFDVTLLRARWNYKMMTWIRGHCNQNERWTEAFQTHELIL